MSTNMKAELCVQTLDNAMASYPALRGTILHSDAVLSIQAIRTAEQSHGMVSGKA